MYKHDQGEHSGVPLTQIVPYLITFSLQMPYLGKKNKSVLITGTYICLSPSSSKHMSFSLPQKYYPEGRLHVSRCLSEVLGRDRKHLQHARICHVLTLIKSPVYRILCVSDAVFTRPHIFISQA